MEIKFKRQHNDSFMIIDAVDTVENYEVKMIGENQIDALLEMSKINFNGVQQYTYNISRKENLEDFLESHDLTIELLRRIVLNIQLAYDELNRFLINERHIWLEIETVYLEKAQDNFKVSLCYYPKDIGTVQEQFRGLFEKILRLVPPGDKKFTKKVYEAYDLCLKEDYTLAEIYDCLQDDESEELIVNKINLRDDGIDEYEEAENIDWELPQNYLADYSDSESEGKTSPLKQIHQVIKTFLCNKIEFKDVFDSASDDFIVEPDCELEQKTQLLTETKPCGKLVYDGQNKEDDFLVNKDVFRIGSGKKNDAILRERTVSTNHAKITREGDDYYLSDLNSTNSTFVNNKELSYRTPVKLKIMDKISFANVNYVFM